jgi:hypothetical protein
MPTPPTSPGSSTSSGDALEVRQRAFDLLNRMGPAADDDENTWPRSPSKAGPRILLSSYQNADHSAATAAREAAFHVEEDEASWGGAVVQGFVQCVSDACKLGASEIVSQNASFARSGYQTLKSVIVAEAQDRMPSTLDRPSGSFESVPIASYHHQHQHQHRGSR